MGILSGDNNPKIFLSGLKDKLKEYEQICKDIEFQRNHEIQGKNYRDINLKKSEGHYLRKFKKLKL